MATYKVIQDIEAEDKFVGPLTLKQFIFAAVLVVLLYLMFLMYTKHVWWLAIPLIPPAILFGFLGFPWKRDQTTEVWLQAKIRFLLKPRKRVWDQAGIKNLVTITAPKKVEKNYTNGLGQDEVRSRLKALANTIDSRGWVIKNVEPNHYGATTTGERLFDIGQTQVSPSLDSSGLDDVLDDNNPLSTQFDNMIDASTQSYRQQLVQRIKDAASPVPQLSTVTANPALATRPLVPASPVATTPFTAMPAAPVNTNQPLTSDEQAFLQQAHQRQAISATENLPTMQPLGQSPIGQPAAQRPAPTTMKTPVDPAILGLAKNDDLNVATIARQANRQNEQQLGDNEVVVSLR